MKLSHQTSRVSLASDCPENISAIFWQQLVQDRDYLYRCCLKWMGNPTEAEDALSLATLKAWEKLQEGASTIKDFKAWLRQLTYNLCVDIHRKRNREAVGFEDLEAHAPAYQEQLVSQEEIPIRAATWRERELFLRDAIDRLPPKLRKSFILKFEEEQSYRDIAQQLNISYENVRQRISQARAILRDRLNEYEGGKDFAPPQRKREKSNSQGEFCQDIQVKTDNLGDRTGEHPTLEAALFLQPIEPVLVEAQSDEKLEEIEIVADGKGTLRFGKYTICNAIEDDRILYKKSVKNYALQKRDELVRKQADLCVLQLAPTVALAKSERETGESSAIVPISEFLLSSLFSIFCQESVWDEDKGWFLWSQRILRREHPEESKKGRYDPEKVIPALFVAMRASAICGNPEKICPPRESHSREGGNPEKICPHYENGMLPITSVVLKWNFWPGFAARFALLLGELCRLLGNWINYTS